MSTRSNAAYRFTLSNPDDEPQHVDDFMRLRYNGADVLVLGVGIALAEVEALDGATFRAWHHELTDVAATDPQQFAGYQPPPRDRPDPAVPPFGRSKDSPLGQRLIRDEEAAESIALAREKVTQRTEHPAVAGELNRTFGFAEGVQAYAHYLRTGEMSVALKQILD